MTEGCRRPIQDGGRPGYLSRGIPPAGAQDFYSLAIANLLVGNELTPPPLSRAAPGAAGLEMLVKGVTLRFPEETVIALAGADMAATVDGAPVERFQPIVVPAGRRTECGTVKSGARGYLAIAGGIDVPLVLGSRATYVRGSQGGLEGRALRKGDGLKTFPPAAPTRDVWRSGASTACRPARTSRRVDPRRPRPAGLHVHRRRASRPSSPPSGGCRRSPTAWACGWSGRRSSSIRGRTT